MTVCGFDETDVSVPLEVERWVTAKFGVPPVDCDVAAPPAPPEVEP